MIYSQSSRIVVVVICQCQSMLYFWFSFASNKKFDIYEIIFVYALQFSDMSNVKSLKFVELFVRMKIFVNFCQCEIKFKKNFTIDLNHFVFAMPLFFDEKNCLFRVREVWNILSHRHILWFLIEKSQIREDFCELKFRFRFIWKYRENWCICSKLSFWLRDKF